jgi:hypothetical protein
MTLNLNQASKDKIEIPHINLGFLLDELKNKGIDNVSVDLNTCSIVLPAPIPEPPIPERKTEQLNL